MEAEENGAEVDIDVDVDVDVDADVRGYKLEQEEGGEGKGAQRRPGGKKRRQRSSVLPDPRRDNGQAGYCDASFRASRPSEQASNQASRPCQGFKNTVMRRANCHAGHGAARGTCCRDAEGAGAEEKVEKEGEKRNRKKETKKR